MSSYLLIDGSYFIFYRIFALTVWWKNAKPDIELKDPFHNPEFVDKFRSTFSSKIKEIIKKLNITNLQKIMVGKDCFQHDIWRKQLYPQYKDGRNEAKNIENNVGDFFKLVYEEDLFKQAGVDCILDYPTLEADDCLALTTNYLLEHLEPSTQIYIVTSDHDYLQLMHENVHIYDCKYKLLKDSKKSFDNPQKNLFFKIVGGDKSDNIMALFKKCGPKTIEKCYSDEKFFQEKLEKEEGAKEKYILNQTLIDFRKIPSDLSHGFLDKLVSLLPS